MSETYTERDRNKYRRVFAHVHVTDPRGDIRDYARNSCLACGLDLRDPIHSNEFLEERKEYDALLERQGRKRY